MTSTQQASKKPNPDSSNGKEAPKTKKNMNVVVMFLDDSHHMFLMPGKALGRTLFDKVCKFLNLLEADYFGLEYEADNTKYWLDGLKPLFRQVNFNTSEPVLYFAVKFYAPDPVQLEDEYTRYLFSLQIKRDLESGSLQCNDNTTAVMISYIVQAEIGNYDVEEYPDHTYLSSHKFIKYQDADLEKKIMESHKKHVGQLPAEAELNLLETSRRCELYGIKMTAAKDNEGVPLNLAVAHLGVLVFQNYTKINTFSWAKIRKLSFKRKKFLIKLHPEGYGYLKDTVEFCFEGRNECKNFWKKCIENHTFFRCSDAKKGMRQKPKFFSRGSSFRYSGRTQVQMSEFVRENYVKRPFERSTSLRTGSASSPPLSGRKTSGSMSPQPLLPVSTSFSCESMSTTPAAAASPLPLKKLSASEPTTPHVAQDISHTVANGRVSTLDSTGQAPSTDLVTPDSEQGELQSPDFLGQDTDDNISQDSYHVTDKDMVKSPTDDSITDIKDQADTEPTLTDPVSAITITEGPKESALLHSVEGKISPTSSSSFPSTPLSSTPVSKQGDGSNKTLSLEVNGKAGDDGLSSPSDQFSFNDYSGRAHDSENNGFSNNNNTEIANSLQSLSICSFDSDSFNSLGEILLVNYKKNPGDKAYWIAKDLLMNERTYRRDLEIVNVVFRDEFSKQGDMPNEAVELMLSAIDPLHEVHCSLLRDLEQRMAFWEGKHMTKIHNGVKAVGDILLNYIKITKIYEKYVEQLPQIFCQVNTAFSTNQRFADFYQQFENQKLCHLPLTSFLIQPLYRFCYYCYVLKEFMSHYGKLHFDFENCQAVFSRFEESFTITVHQIPQLVNLAKLFELKRSLCKFPDIFCEDRVFIREGCLQKLSKNGNHQCMLFLFSDILLYAKQGHGEKLLFSVYRTLFLKDLEVEKAEPRQGSNYCFMIREKERCLLLCASSEKEQNKWISDLKEAIKQSKSSTSDQTSQSNGRDIIESSLNAPDKEEKRISRHINSSVHVCWHRNISIGKNDLLTACKYSISGFLLRKFTNNSGWQKLWVVLTNLCLFFYKSFLDESPLASLPLAGYRVLMPSADDSYTKDFVFKLQYKNHEYYFCSESKYSFDRWMEVVAYSTLADDENTHL